MIQVVRQEVGYCSQYVAQSRKTLVDEFDKWYRAAFVGEEAPEEKKEEIKASLTIKPIIIVTRSGRRRFCYIYR